MEWRSNKEMLRRGHRLGQGLHALCVLDEAGQQIFEGRFAHDEKAWPSFVARWFRWASSWWPSSGQRVS